MEFLKTGSADKHPPAELSKSNYYLGISSEKSILADHFLDYSIKNSHLSSFGNERISRKERRDSAPGNDTARKN